MRRRLLRRRAKDERGFTIVELLVAITIMPMVVGVLAGAFIMVSHGQSTVSNRLADSADVQTTSAWFARDVQSASEITTSSAVTSPALCGSGTTLALALEWPSGSSQSVVSYWVVPVSGPTTTYTVVRRFCTGGLSVPTQSVTVARDVSAGQQPAAVTPAGSSASQWIASAGVESVALTVTAPASTFTYQLAAAPRAWTPTSGGLPWGGSPALLLLLGSTANVLTVSGGPNAITVNGPLVVDSSATNAIKVTGGGNTVTAGGGAISFFNCNPGTPNGGACTNSPVSGAGVSPVTDVSIAAALADPYASLPAPSDPTGTGTCTPSGTTYTCSGGVYASTPTFPGGTTSVAFTGSATFPAGTALTLSSITATFASGVYIFHGGVTVSGGTNNITATNVLFYFDGSAQLNIGNGPTTVSMSPMTGGVYAGVAIFQPKTDTQALTLTGGSNSLSTDLDPTNKGVIEIPGAQLALSPSGGPNTVAAGNIIAKSLAAAGGGNHLTVG